MVRKRLEWSDDHIPLKLDPDSLHVAERLRPINEKAVAALVESFKQIGMLTPIHYRLTDGVEIDGKVRNGVPVLIAGAHRLAAAKQLGWPTIPAIEVTEDSLTARLWEVDENLVRHELGPAEQARALARRKEIYEELHPETKAGQAQALGMNQSLGHNVGTKMVPTFTEDTVRRTGKSKTSVNRGSRRGLEIAPDVLDAVNGTTMDKATELDAVVKLSPDDQRKAVALVKDGSAETLRAAAALIKPTKGGLPEATTASAPSAEVPAGDADGIGKTAVALALAKRAEDDVDRNAPASLDKQARKRHEEYMLAHDVICGTCSLLHTIEVPDHFSPQELAELVTDLEGAEKSIEALRIRLITARNQAK